VPNELFLSAADRQLFGPLSRPSVGRTSLRSSSVIYHRRSLWSPSLCHLMTDRTHRESVAPDYSKITLPCDNRSSTRGPLGNNGGGFIFIILYRHSSSI